MIPGSLRTALCAVALLVSASAAAQSAVVQAPAPMSPDTVLADNGIARITRADYDLELTKLPPAVRGGFATSEKRVVDLINRMLVTRTLALQADQAKLLDDPETARRIAAEMERIKSLLMIAKIERDAAAAFDANPAPYETRARDLYLTDPRKYDVGGEVSASHILFATPPHSVEEATRLAREARAAIVAGADFNAVARERSEDPSAKDNAGRLGWFKRGQMDAEFEGAAFALAKKGEISEPVVSSFGVHLIRLDDRREAQRVTFEQAKPRIMAEQRQQYIDAQKDAALEKLRTEAFKGTDMAKVDAMQREALQRQQEALRERTRQPPK
ncbi:MAG TPA: peptidylprolyl isomerase [Casimicrobiaceae bacterium]|nr:peptidylprolyl isomerase [Casimicrobiaceae bacterium]